MFGKLEERVECGGLGGGKASSVRERDGVAAFGSDRYLQ